MKFFNDLTETFTTLNHLLHWQQDGATYFLTYRQGDSIPRELMDDWQARRAAWIAPHPKPWDGETEAEYHNIFSAEIDRMLDKGEGTWLLRAGKGGLPRDPDRVFRSFRGHSLSLPVLRRRSVRRCFLAMKFQQSLPNA